MLSLDMSINGFQKSYGAQSSKRLKGYVHNNIVNQTLQQLDLQQQHLILDAAMTELTKT